MALQVTVLSQEQLKERYERLAKTRMAKLTREAIERGNSIALIEGKNLDRNELLTHDVQVALEQSVPKSSVIEIWCYTDMSEMQKGKLYVAFKELKFRACAHGNSKGCFRISG